VAFEEAAGIDFHRKTPGKPPVLIPINEEEIMKNIKSNIAVLMLALALGTGSALAAKTIKVVVIDGYPAKVLWVKEFSNFFIPEVDKRLAESGEYEIEWQESYGGSIVKPKGVLEGVRLGLGDIGIVTTIFHSSKLPSQAISAVTPFIAPDAQVVAKAVDEVAKEFPSMQAELARQNQVYLATGVVLDTYQIFSREKVTSIKDIEGSKVAGAGMNLRYLEGIPNAAGVRGGLTDFYNMLQTGLVDHAMLWPEAAKKFKLVEVAPYMLRVNLGAVNSKTVTVNSDFWKTLPDQVKTVLLEVAVDYRDHVAALAMSGAAKSHQAFVDDGGTIVDISTEERAQWAAAMPNIAVEWATKLDEAGQPGSKMLRAYMGKLSAAGFTPLRDWAAELP
jgi:C4-dicarboxylate-binding protein DctP